MATLKQLEYWASLKGKHFKNSGQFKKGKKCPEIGLRQLGNNNPIHNHKFTREEREFRSRTIKQQWIDGSRIMSEAFTNKGNKHTEETKKKISLANGGKLIGEKNPRWKGGKGTDRHRLMGQADYILWRTAVFMRDDYTCQICNIRGGELNADHIKPWALFPELRYAIDNGRTLCVTCHRQTDTWGGRISTRKVSD